MACEEVRRTAACCTRPCPGHRQRPESEACDVQQSGAEPLEYKSFFALVFARSQLTRSRPTVRPRAQPSATPISHFKSLTTKIPHQKRRLPTKHAASLWRIPRDSRFQRSAHDGGGLLSNSFRNNIGMPEHGAAQIAPSTLSTHINARAATHTQTHTHGTTHSQGSKRRGRATHACIIALFKPHYKGQLGGERREARSHPLISPPSSRHAAPSLSGASPKFVTPFPPFPAS